MIDHSCLRIKFLLTVELCVFQVIARTNELLENSNEQRKKQEKALEEKQEQISKVEANMKSVTADVIKVIGVGVRGLDKMVTS